MTKDEIKNEFLTKSKMTKIIESTALDMKMSYMDAILYICEDKGIEPDEVSKFISPVIKGKLEQEAIELHYIKSDSNTLPL
tara:strand:- start:106 stop:348 length:243 start_codon:yes stop_codon:yes gene_type:complete